MLKWTKQLPESAGLYLRKNPAGGCICRQFVYEIDGVLKVNPEWELLGTELSKWAGHGQFWWYGPIPSPPTDDTAYTSHGNNTQEQANRLREALTPSADTKHAYWGSDEHEIANWNDIKTIMRLIRKRAGLEVL